MTMRFIHTRASLAAGLALAAGVAACNTDNITSLNQNPNSPEDVPAAPLFTNAVRLGVGRWLGSNYDLRQMEFLSQHLAEVQYPNEDNYSRLRASDTQAWFQSATLGAYATSLQDFQQVVRKGQAANSAAIWAPASILQQWEFGYLTDNWGDVPYSQALAGDSAGVMTPAYDAQKDIYTGMFAKLTAASTALATPGTQSLGGADPIYGGDAAAWRKFANTLRARYAMRIVNVDPALANTQLTAALSAPGGVFTSNADMAMVVWPGDGVYNNSWADNFKTRDDHRMSKTFTDILVGTSDPRLPVFAMPTVNFQNGVAGAPEYAGQPNGLDAATAGTYFNSASRPGEIFYPGATTYGSYGGSGAKQPSYLMTYAELAFIKAEAAERSMGGLAPGQAGMYYADGIRASMAQWGITDETVIAAYLAEPGVAYVGGLEGQKQIAVQKWIALYSDGGQAWFEWRRTCQPATIKPGPTAIFSFVPRRLEYPTGEYSVNGASVAAANARQGADAMGTRVWWDRTGAPTCS